MNIFDEFEKTSKKTWIAKVEKDLKGKSPADYFVLLGDEIKINPFFHNENKFKLNIPKNKENNRWLINEQIELSENQNLNTEILKALEGGANSISIVINKIWKIEDFKNAFKGVYLNFISISFQFEIDDENIEKYFQIFEKYLHGISLKAADILGSVYKKNTIVKSDLFSNFQNLKNYIFSSKKSLEINQQIADLLIDAEFILSISEDKNDQIKISKKIIFELKISNSFYLNIAKIRALKLLWGTILNSYKIEFNIFIKAIINTELEKNENTAIIAATNQAISAIIGGVDMLEIKPFAHKKAEYGDDFSKRIARNIQNILSVESQFSTVIDPINGSYFLDNLTKNICESAWAEFQKSIKND